MRPSRRLRFLQRSGWQPNISKPTIAGTKRKEQRYRTKAAGARLDVGPGLGSQKSYGCLLWSGDGPSRWAAKAAEMQTGRNAAQTCSAWKRYGEQYKDSPDVKVPDPEAIAEAEKAKAVALEAYGGKSWPWIPEELRMLATLVRRDGPSRWAAKATEMQTGRNAAQTCSAWKRYGEQYKDSPDVKVPDPEAIAAAEKAKAVAHEAHAARVAAKTATQTQFENQAACPSDTTSNDHGWKRPLDWDILGFKMSQSIGETISTCRMNLPLAVLQMMTLTFLSRNWSLVWWLRFIQTRVLTAGRRLFGSRALIRLPRKCTKQSM